MTSAEQAVKHDRLIGLPPARPSAQFADSTPGNPPPEGCRRCDAERATLVKPSAPSSAPAGAPPTGGRRLRINKSGDAFLAKCCTLRLVSFGRDESDCPHRRHNGRAGRIKHSWATRPGGGVLSASLRAARRANHPGPPSPSHFRSERHSPGVEQTRGSSLFHASSNFHPAGPVTQRLLSRGASVDSTPHSFGRPSREGRGAKKREGLKETDPPARQLTESLISGHWPN